MVAGPDSISNVPQTSQLGNQPGGTPETSNKTSDFAAILSRQVSDANLALAQSAGIDAPPPASADRDTQLRWAAQQLEAMYLQELFTAMRKTVPEGGLFSQNFSTRTYQEMLDAEQAKSLAQAGGVGLAEVILKQMRGEK